MKGYYLKATGKGEKSKRTTTAEGKREKIKKKKLRGAGSLLVSSHDLLVLVHETNNLDVIAETNHNILQFGCLG